MSSNTENQKRKILTVDDDPQSLAIVKKALEWEGYQVNTAQSGAEALDKIENWEPHLVLLDVNMPNLNGLETLKLLRKSLHYISTLFVSGQSNIEDIVSGLDAGADDYICKPYNPVELLSRIRCQLRIKDLRDELSSANLKLKDLVDRDDLTDLFNMRSLYQKLDHALERAARYQRQTSVIMMDMDKFKSVNDDNDHLFGSYVLTEVGQLIKENLRKVDFAARYGGDEFLIVLTETSFNGSKIFCEKLKQSIEDYNFKTDRYEMKLTASMGFAITQPGHKFVDARTLVRYADHALYKAKENGRNRIEFYEDPQEKI